MADLRIQLGSLKLKNPVLTASGTFGYGTEFSEYFDPGRLGGLITKTITLEPREGNPMPRIVETPAGMLNSIGLANVGLDRFVREKLPALEKLDTAVIVNIAGRSVEEYVRVAEGLQGRSRVDAIEVNVSCPNVKQGGLAFGTDPSVTREVVSSLKRSTDKMLIVKLTPNVTDIRTVAQAAVEAGADALSLINTVLGMTIDIRTRKPTLARGIGGLSGPAILPIALAKVHQVRKVVSVPIIGIGGIMTWQDAVMFLLVGATAVQVGTLHFVDPSGAIRIIEGLEEFCRQEGISNIQELIGGIREWE